MIILSLSLAVSLVLLCSSALGVATVLTTPDTLDDHPVIVCVVSLVLLCSSALDVVTALTTPDTPR